MRCKRKCGAGYSTLYMVRVFGTVRKVLRLARFRIPTNLSSNAKLTHRLHFKAPDVLRYAQSTLVAIALIDSLVPVLAARYEYEAGWHAKLLSRKRGQWKSASGPTRRVGTGRPVNEQARLTFVKRAKGEAERVEADIQGVVGVSNVSRSMKPEALTLVLGQWDGPQGRAAADRVFYLQDQLVEGRVWWSDALLRLGADTL